MKVIVQRKPEPIPPDYRPLYKISIILMVLYLCSRGKKASLMKLHLFSWIVKSEEHRKVFLEKIKEEKIPDIWSIEPALNRALLFAEAEKLCKFNSANYKLTDKGKMLVEKFINEEGLFKIEKEFLENVGLRVTEKTIKETTKKWTKKYA